MTLIFPNVVPTEIEFELGASFYVRECDPKHCEKVFKLFDTTAKVVTITGTPGEITASAGSVLSLHADAEADAP